MKQCYAQAAFIDHFDADSIADAGSTITDCMLLSCHG